MERLVILNGDVVTGDGKTVLKNTGVIVQDHTIVDLVPGQLELAAPNGGKVIDATNKYVIPGLINHHAHGISLGPLFSSCVNPLPQDQVLKNLNKHLLQGTTTILSLDGFATVDEVQSIARLHSILLRMATSHTPWNFKAAEAGDGSGLKVVHRQTSAQEMIAAGAVAFGEIGSGATLGGGVQEYLYIPAAIKKKTGRELPERQARALKTAVLGRYMQPSAYDPVQTARVLKENHLDDCLTPEETRDLVSAIVLPPISAALQGLKEAGEMAKQFGIPLIVHNSAPSKEVILEMAQRGLGRLLIAGHSNHTTFDLGEAVSFARQLKEHGAVIDISTFGSFQANDSEEMEMQFLMLREGVVETVSTDYGGGAHDPMLVVLEKAIARHCLDLPTAIALVTNNVAHAVPLLAPNRGIVA